MPVLEVPQPVESPTPAVPDAPISPAVPEAPVQPAVPDEPGVPAPQPAEGDPDPVGPTPTEPDAA
jgi:hypothetical protein